MPTTLLVMRLALVVLAALGAACNGLGAANSGSSEPQTTRLIARPEALDLRRIWSGPSGGFPTSSPSPDGRYMTDIDWDTGDLAVIDFETGKRRRVTDKGPWSKSNDYAEWSIFAPDGQRIAYSWFNGQARGYEVRTIRIDGSEMRTIFPRKSDVAYVAVEDWSPNDSILVTVARSDRTTQIGTISLPDASYHALKTNDWRQPQEAVFSTDGRYIAYDLFRSKDETASRTTQKDIFLLAVDGSREVPLVTASGNNSLLGWLPDGRGILYHTRTKDSSAIWALAIENGQPIGRPELVRPDASPMLPLGFSRDALVYGKFVERPQIHVVGVDLANGRAVTEPAPMGDPGEGAGHHPAWSPDGQMVAYLTNGPGPLVIRSATGELRREIPLPLSEERRTRWTPDGTAVLVYGVDREGRQGIHRVDLRTGTMKLVLGGSPSALTEGISWWALSPDANTIYHFGQKLEGERHFTGAGGPLILAHDLRTGETREIHRADQLGRMLSVSPDGKWLAYAMQNLGPSEFRVMIVPTAGGNAREVYRERGNGLGNRGSIEWAPDGRSLLTYAAPAEGPGGIWQVPLDGGAPRLLLDDRHITPLVQGTRERPQDFRLSPDGRRLAYQAGRDRGEIWMMSGFGAAASAAPAAR